MSLHVLVFALTLPGLAAQSSSPEELYRRGLDSYNAGRYEEAVDYFSRATAFRPNVPDYRFSLGLAYLKLGKPKKAAYELEAVRGMTGLQRRTRVKEPEVLVYSAVAYIQLGKLKGARSRLELALEREPEMAEAHYALGLVEQEEGNPEKAVNHFQAALATEPDHPEANMALASWLREQGRIAEAYERLRHASHGAPESFETQMALGAAAYQQGLLDEALVAFKDALELRPQDVDAQYNLGTVLLVKEDYQGAIEVLEPLVRGDELHDGACFNLAQAYLATEKKEGAASILEALAERSPHHPKVHFTLGLVFEQMGDAARAEQAYREEITVRPAFVSAYLNLAALLESQKRRDEALEQLKLALAQSSEEGQAEQIQAAITAIEESR
jgi:tetratricopeptide (TPR) repeat protein